MAKKRIRSNETESVEEASSEAPSDVTPKVAENPVQELNTEVPVPVEETNTSEVATTVTQSDPKQPVNLELRVGDNESRTPKELTKESIEVSVRKKLAKKTDDDYSDPFVPQAQLDNEVVQVAREKGFPLSRGTEIGARLLARARRPKQ